MSSRIDNLVIEGGGTGSVEVLDTLDSTSAIAALSANKGRELKETIDGFGEASTKDVTDVISENSQELITSGAVYTAVSNLENINSNVVNAFSTLGMSEESKTDGYEIALAKSTNTAQKTKVKVPVFDAQNTANNPVGLVDETFVEDMATMMDDKIEAALDGFSPEVGGESTEVIDSLTSASTTAALSANQGNVLNEKIKDLQGQIDADTTNLFNESQARINDVAALQERANSAESQVAQLNTRTQSLSAEIDRVELYTGVEEYPLYDDTQPYSVGDIVRLSTNELRRFTADYNGSGTPQYEPWNLVLDTERANAPDNMGYVILRKELTFAEQVTKENTIYEVRYDFDLGGETVEILDGCELNIIGGSISNGVLAGDFTINSKSEYIFRGVRFEGNCQNKCFDLDWFVSKKNKAVITDGTQQDSTAEIQAAFDSGVFRLYVDNKYYYYISNTLRLKSYVRIDGNQRGKVSIRVAEQAPPCFYTDKEIVVLEITPDSFGGKRTNSSVDVRGIAIRRYHESTIDFYDNYKEAIPTILVAHGPYVSGANNHLCWGVHIDVDCYSADVPHEFEDDRVAYFCGYTGIELCARNAGYLTYIVIGGSYTGFRRGVYAHVDKSNDGGNGASWMTDITFEADTVCTYGGTFEEGFPVRITGSHQAKFNVTKEDEQHYFTIAGDGVATGMVWDVNLYNSSTKLYTVEKPYKARYDFKDLVSQSETTVFENSVVPSGTPNIRRVADYKYKFTDWSANYLEALYCRMNGNQLMELSSCPKITDAMKEYKGWHEYSRLYKLDEEGNKVKNEQTQEDDYVDIDESTVTNYAKLYKMSGNYGITESVHLAKVSDDTCSVKTSVDVSYSLYECKFVFPYALFNAVIARNMYLTAISTNHNTIDNVTLKCVTDPVYDENNELVTEGKEELVAMSVSSADVYYSHFVCKLMPVVPECDRIEMTISADLYQGARRVIPKIGIMGHWSPNIITSSGGEIPHRVALGDVMLYHNEQELINDENYGYRALASRYLNNKYINIEKNLTKQYNSLLCVQSYNNFQIVITYKTNAGTSGTLLFSKTNIINDSDHLSFRVLTQAEAGKDRILLQAKTNVSSEKLFITDVLCFSRLAFFDIDAAANYTGASVEGLAKFVNGTTSNRPTNTNVGHCYFDTDLNKPVWWNGTNWVDVSGTNV